MRSIPMNFRVPADLKAEFERTCRSLNLPMSAQLIFMMREFVGAERFRKQREALDDGPIAFFSNNQ